MRVRWGSKSWSGFSPRYFPRCDSAFSGATTRGGNVVFINEVLDNGKDFKPKPVVENGKQVAAEGGVPTQTFTATVEIQSVPARRNPAELDYSEALNHFPAIIQDGPFAGQEIGVRSWSMYDSDLLEPAFTAAGKQRLR